MHSSIFFTFTSRPSGCNSFYDFEETLENGGQWSFLGNGAQQAHYCHSNLAEGNLGKIISLSDKAQVCVEMRWSPCRLNSKFDLVVFSGGCM